MKIITEIKCSWKRCNKTGRRLNLFNDQGQVHGMSITNDENTANLAEVKLAERLRDKYEATKARKSPKRSLYVYLLFTWLIHNRNNKRVVQINYSNKLLTLNNCKLVIVELEELGLLEVFQGFACKTGARPMAVWINKHTQFLERLEDDLEDIHNELMKEGIKE